MSSSSRMEIYRMINESREVYESEESPNELVYIPNNSILVQSDRRFFKFIIGLKYGINTIPVNWNFKSRDYKKDGMINIIVSPRYEEKTEIKYCSELREPEVRIEAKMLDENEKE